MRLRAGLISAFLALLLLTGALGLRLPEECDNDPAVVRNSDKMACFYQAALTVAYLCGTYQASGVSHCSRAINVCDGIWTRFGTDGSASNDQKRKAELMSNQCFFEVAKITRDSSVCGYIGADHSGQISGSVGHQLVGDQVTRDACTDETERLAALAPDRYYQTGTNNICSIVFILPVFVLGALVIGNPKN